MPCKPPFLEPYQGSVDESTDELLHEIAESGYLNQAYSNTFDFLNLVSQETGEPVEQKTFAKIKKAHSVCRSFSLDVARKLESVEQGSGFNPQSAKLTSVGLFSGMTDTMPDYAQRTIIPEIANKKRQFYLTQLKYFCSKNKHLRYFVVNEGSRCSIDELEDRIKSLQRKCSNIRDREWFKPFADVFFRSTEFTIKEEKDGSKSYHVHANLVWATKKHQPSEQWKRFISRVEDYFGGISRDCKRIENENEICKYFFKGSDLAILSAQELHQLSRILFKKRLIAPLSTMRDQVRYFRNHPEEKLQQPCKANGMKWKIVSNHNSFKQFDESYDLKPIFEEDKKESTDKPVDQVLAIMGPQIKFTDVAEPIVLVRGYSGKLEELLKNKRVEMTYNAGKLSWLAGLQCRKAQQKAEPSNKGSQEVLNCPKDSKKPERLERSGSFSGANPPPRSGRKLSFGLHGDVSHLQKPKKPDQLSLSGSFSGTGITSSVYIQ